MFNLSAIYTIVASRLREFFHEYHYSLLAPLTTNLLFILVFLTVENYYSLSIDSGSFVEKGNFKSSFQNLSGILV